MRHAVRSRQMVDGVPRDHLPERKIGPVVAGERRLDGQDAPFAVHSKSGVVTLAAIRRAAEEVLPP